MYLGLLWFLASIYMCRSVKVKARTWDAQMLQTCTLGFVFSTAAYCGHYDIKFSLVPLTRGKCVKANPIWDMRSVFQPTKTACSHPFWTYFNCLGYL